MLGADAAADGASKGGSILAFGQSVFKRSFFKFLEHFRRQLKGSLHIAPRATVLWRGEPGR
jgi:hypothetical protein